MNTTIMPGKLKGRIKAIPSKSMAHRVLICAALSDEPTLVKNMGDSEDIKATKECLNALGARFVEKETGLMVYPISSSEEELHLFCKESGATLRMLLPVCAALTNEVYIHVEESLAMRPLEPLVKALESGGKHFGEQSFPMEMSGSLKGTSYEIVGNVSSQFISGLLLMAPLLKEDIIIKVTTEIESLPYIQMTCQIMKQFGVEIEVSERQYTIRKENCYHSPKEITIEGDWSNASYFLIADALGSEVVVEGLYEASVQADRQIIDILPEFGYEISRTAKGINVKMDERVQSQAFRQIDLMQSPDLLPGLAVLAGATPGVTVFKNIRRQRYKESNRIETCAMLLRMLGRYVQETENEMIVGGGTLTGGTVESCNDHRIVMAATIAACVAKEGIVIVNSDTVKKSYPQFMEDIIMLGGHVF